MWTLLARHSLTGGERGHPVIRASFLPQSTPQLITRQVWPRVAGSHGWRAGVGGSYSHAWPSLPVSYKARTWESCHMPGHKGNKAKNKTQGGIRGLKA